MGLAAQFLLGMAVNLLSLPSQAKGTAHTATTVFLAAHMHITLGLPAGAIMIIRATAPPQNPARQLAIWGAIAIAATTAAGVLTMTTKSNWWSPTTALGFIASLLPGGGNQRIEFIADAPIPASPGWAPGWRCGPGTRPP